MRMGNKRAAVGITDCSSNGTKRNHPTATLYREWAKNLLRQIITADPPRIVLVRYVKEMLKIVNHSTWQKIN